MNTLEVQTKINQKLSRLSPEQLGVVWNFVESLKTASVPVMEETPRKTILERMGGYPDCLLDEDDQDENLSDRDVRKKIIAEKIRHRHQERHQ
jgi:hypothetical protein